MKYLFQFLLTGMLIYFIPKYFSGIRVDDMGAAIVFSIILAALNLFLGTILRILTFPVRLITLGLFGFVIWGFLIYLTDRLVPGIKIEGIIPLAIMTLLLTALSFILKLLWK